MELKYPPADFQLPGSISLCLRALYLRGVLSILGNLIGIILRSWCINIKAPSTLSRDSSVTDFCTVFKNFHRNPFCSWFHRYPALSPFLLYHFLTGTQHCLPFSSVIFSQVPSTVCLSPLSFSHRYPALSPFLLCHFPSLLLVSPEFPKLLEFDPLSQHFNVGKPELRQVTKQNTLLAFRF